MVHKSKLFFLIVLIVCLSGCSGQGNTGAEESHEEKRSVAMWDTGNISGESMLSPMLMEDNLYYWTGDWDNVSKRWSNSSIYRKSGGETDGVEITALGDCELIYFLVDEDYNLYYIYAEYEGEDKSLFFRKQSKDGELLSDVPVSVSEEMSEEFTFMNQNGYITHGTVSRQGEVCLRGWGGELYLFDESGNLCCIGRDEWDGEAFQYMEKGIVNAGEAGIFTYAAGNKALFRKINMEDASLGTVIEVEPGTEASLDIFSGYDKGIIISDSSRLWTYDLWNRQLNVVLDWDDEGVKLNYYEISLVSLLEGGRVYVMAKKPSGHDTKFVYIEERESSEIPEKQTVVLGTYEFYDPEGNELSDLDQMVGEFNKYQQEYEIVIKRYESAQDMYMELLKGEGPDCFQLIGKSVLASKGVLEDLSPYFEKSLKVKETELLLSVRNAGSEEGGLQYIFTRFALRGLIVEKGATQNGGWTPEEYLQLGEQYPEALLTPQISPYMVLRYAVSADMDSFLDWQGRKCCFDSERFISILESIKRVTDEKQMADIMEWRLNACQWLYDKQILTEHFQIETFREYIEYRDAYEDFAEFAGYPNSDKKPYYSFVPDYVFAMNSASQIKEGVWAFLEYLLSEEYQSSVTSFPVREDIFNKHIDKQIADWKRRAENDPGQDMNNVSLTKWDKYPEVTEEDEEFIRYMAENAYWDTSLDDVLSIIYEETDAFWAGDKSAEEVASIIQNRVTLYLNEL